MRFADGPADLTPSERFRELASLLATALLRRRARPPLPDLDSAATSLEVSRTTSVTGPRG